MYVCLGIKSCMSCLQLKYTFVIVWLQRLALAYAAMTGEEVPKEPPSEEKELTPEEIVEAARKADSNVTSSGRHVEWEALISGDAQVYTSSTSIGGAAPPQIDYVLRVATLIFGSHVTPQSEFNGGRGGPNDLNMDHGQFIAFYTTLRSLYALGTNTTTEIPLRRAPAELQEFFKSPGHFFQLLGAFGTVQRLADGLQNLINFEAKASVYGWLADDAIPLPQWIALSWSRPYRISRVRLRVYQPPFLNMMAGSVEQGLTNGAELQIGNVSHTIQLRRQGTKSGGPWTPVANITGRVFDREWITVELSPNTAANDTVGLRVLTNVAPLPFGWRAVEVWAHQRVQIGKMYHNITSLVHQKKDEGGAIQQPARSHPAAMRLAALQSQLLIWHAHALARAEREDISTGREFGGRKRQDVHQSASNSTGSDHSQLRNSLVNASTITTTTSNVTKWIVPKSVNIAWPPSHSAAHHHNSNISQNHMHDHGKGNKTIAMQLAHEFAGMLMHGALSKQRQQMRWSGARGICTIMSLL